jgi:Flp pilus assembly pilin Flp
MMNFLDSLGQATVEYILIFAFMAMISLGIVRAIGGGVSTSVGTLAYTLTQELSTGVCAKNCFYSGFINE